MRNKIYLKYALSFRTLSGSARGNKEIQIRVSIQRIQQIVKSSRKKKKAGENESQKIDSKISQNSGFEFEIETSAALCFVAQSCLTLCNPMTVAHKSPLSMGILQARILEWVVMPSSRGSSQPRDRTQVS